MRAAAAGRLALGAVCLAAPAVVVRRVGPASATTPLTVTLARVLGARLVLQAAGDVVLGPRTRPVDMTIDLVHATSMVELARRFPRHRRVALVSGGCAAGLAVLDAAAR